ncbi:fructosamine kinase family protein [Pasteurella multocida]|uniref:fructosamine kinase family protein n=1 Tax=Pasteurella multocida TaxID=747 RepID=UPI0011194BD1|nr:fructosamine kinase family protein [Pasteurella multocida]QDA12021.1 fructosamine kinase family protein [Pasteurella multocida subsp. multocida]
MWKHVSQVLADQFGAYYPIKHKEKIHTGEMHEAWIIDDGIQPVFLKVNDKTFRSMFRAEADQLLLLAKTNTINVPNVYTVGCSHTHSFLLLEALPLDKTNPVDAMGKFGEQLAKLHLIKGADNYGLDFDTWLGPEYQPNGWKENWATFFSEQRIGWQLQICREKNLVFGDIEVLVKKVAELLAKHKPQPALLHGNLWIENCATVKQEIFTYDPACYWGDRECDLAFSELFEPFPRQFYESYDRTYPIDKGYPERKAIYQLYYLLNFSHRFNKHYVELTKKFIHDILSR